MSEPSHFFLKKRRVGCNETRGQRLGIMMIIRNITMAMKIIPIPSPNRFGRSASNCIKLICSQPDQSVEEANEEQQR